jgi:hypothetical protein
MPGLALARPGKARFCAADHIICRGPGVPMMQRIKLQERAMSSVYLKAIPMSLTLIALFALVERALGA